MSASLSFKPTLAPTVAAIAAVIITALLGDWQLNRAAYKADLQTRLQQAAREPAIAVGRDPVDAAAVVYHPVLARGELDEERTVFLDNRVHQGLVGFLVASPLRIAG